MQPENDIIEVRSLAYQLRKKLLLFPPIDLLLIARVLEIEVKNELLPVDVPGFYLITPAGRRIIYINSDMPLGRRRFTLAHEIGHHFFGNGSNEAIHLEANRRAPVEIACDRFAVELLMPSQLLENRLTDLKHLSICSRLDAIEKEFEVSRQALLKRIDELGLKLSWPMHI